MALSAAGESAPTFASSLENTLPNYVLPAPPEGEELVGAVRSSLACLDVASDRITFPVIASAYRAALGAATFSIHIVGASGQGKSQLAALAQQHFGAPMDADHPPAAWGDTALAILTLAFFAKDAVLLVDDFVLKGNAAEQQNYIRRRPGFPRAGEPIRATTLNGRRPTCEQTVLRAASSSRPASTLREGKILNARLILLPFLATP